MLLIILWEQERDKFLVFFNVCLSFVRFQLLGLAIVFTSYFSRDSGMLNSENQLMNKDSGDCSLDLVIFINFGLLVVRCSYLGISCRVAF